MTEASLDVPIVIHLFFHAEFSKVNAKTIGSGNGLYIPPQTLDCAGETTLCSGGDTQYYQNEN